MDFSPRSRCRFWVIGDAVGHADAAIGEGQELWVALRATLVDLAIGEFAVGVDLAVDPHRGGGQEHDVQALFVINGDQWLAKCEDFAECEGPDVLTGATVDDLGVELRFLISAEIEDAEFTGLIGFAGHADFLRPVEHARALIEQDAVGGGAIELAVGHTNDGAD